MPSWLRSSIANVGWRMPLLHRLSPRSTVVLVYHGVPRTGEGLNAVSFEQQIQFLKRYCDFCLWEQQDELRPARARVRVLLTFDDGFRNNAEVVAPILRRNKVPAIFFVSSRHIGSGQYLWFTYLRMLEERFAGEGFTFRDEYFDMSAGHRRQTIARLRRVLLQLKPHPGAMYDAINQELPRVDKGIRQEVVDDAFAGMTVAQLSDLASDPLFRVGAHTVDHPFLPLCDKAEQLRQLSANRCWLESIIRRNCDAVAYPAGEYNSDVVESCREVGFTRGFALHRKGNVDPLMEIPRVDIYYPSLAELGFKVRWGNLLTWAHARGFAYPN